MAVKWEWRFSIRWYEYCVFKQCENYKRKGTFPFKIYPEADFLVIAWPMGLVQASCNPFKKDRALKGVNLGDVAQEVLKVIEPQLKAHMVPISVIKRVGETKADEDSIGFKTSDLFNIKFLSFIFIELSYLFSTGLTKKFQTASINIVNHIQQI